MIKKIILEINIDKLEKKLKEKNNIKIKYRDLQYREAILEILENDRQIDLILIDEKLPGIISIEELIKKIKIINNKINIIFFWEKENQSKKDVLNKLNVKDIFSNKKIDINKILNIIVKQNNVKNKRKEQLKKNHKIITIIGKSEIEKIAILNLIIIYLLKNNKKILLINLNKNKIDKNYLISVKNLNKIRKYKYKKFIKKDCKNIFLKSEIKISNDFRILNNFQKLIKENDNYNLWKYFSKFYTKKYDYILVDTENDDIGELNQKIGKISDKRIAILSADCLGIRELYRFNLKAKMEDGKSKKSLHIILIKNYFNSISTSILKNLVGKKVRIESIFYSKELLNLYKKFSKSNNIKVNLFFKNRIDKIIK